jgi:hypothetical protein
MSDIPNSINGVEVEFSDAVNTSVDQGVIDALNKVVKPGIATGHLLNKIYISSANDQHQSPSRHVQEMEKPKISQELMEIKCQFFTRAMQL